MHPILQAFSALNPMYLVIIAACVITSIALAVHVGSNLALSTSDKRWFRLCFIGIALGAVAEMLGDVFNGNPAFIVPHVVAKVAQFSIAPLLPVCLAKACGGQKSADYVGMLMLAHAVAELVLLPFGAVVAVDAQGVYHRGSLYVLYMVSCVISFGYLLVRFVHLSRRFQRRDLFTLLCTPAVTLTCVVPALLDRHVHTSFLGMTLTAAILFVYYGGLMQQELLADIAQRNDRIAGMQRSTIIGMANLIESRDGSTGEHVKNTAAYVGLLAQAALEEGLYPQVIDAHFVELAQSAAPLHDVGKVVVPDHILNKPGRFTPEEFEIMKRHAAEGGNIVRQVLSGVTDADYLEIASDIATYHHEKWDGSGYPAGLAGEQIPVAARIMAIADVYDALISKRVYKDAMPREQALGIIEHDAGSHFDPQLAPLFVGLMRAGEAAALPGAPELKLDR